MNIESERLLEEWLNISVVIRNHRFVSSMSYNELLICGLLYREQSNSTLTATDICNETHLLKSQVNKILSALEEQDYIKRVRSSQDKRRVSLAITTLGTQSYLSEHEQILKLLEQVIQSLGVQKADTLAALLHETTDVILKIKDKKNV